jgi:hypothetical protein
MSTSQPAHLLIAHRLSTGHGRARSNITLPSQSDRQVAAFDAARLSFVSGFTVVRPAASARSQSVGSPAAPKSP